VQTVTYESHLLGRAELAQEHRVFNRHQAINGSIDKQQSATLHVYDASLDQRPSILGVVHEVIVVLVAKLLC
jgi:hypothetical protein